MASTKVSTPTSAQVAEEKGLKSTLQKECDALWASADHLVVLDPKGPTALGQIAGRQGADPSKLSSLLKVGKAFPPETRTRKIEGVPMGDIPLHFDYYRVLADKAEHAPEMLERFVEASEGEDSIGPSKALLNQVVREVRAEHGIVPRSAPTKSIEARTTSAVDRCINSITKDGHAVDPAEIAVLISALNRLVKLARSVK